MVEVRKLNTHEMNKKMKKNHCNVQHHDDYYFILAQFVMNF
jgi:hypothetical protein